MPLISLRKLGVVLLAGALLWLGIRYLLPVFLPFLLAAVMALASEPLVRVLRQRLKLPQAAAAGVSGGLLTWIGYSDATAFEPSVTLGIFNISTLVPAAGFLLLALILWFWYPLHKAQVDNNVAALKKKCGEDV